MEHVRRWLNTAMLMHMERFHIEDWPQPGTDAHTDMVRLWAYHLTKENISERDFDFGSRELIHNEPKKGHQHLGAIIAAVKRLRREKASTSVQGSVEHAALASTTCPYCTEEHPIHGGPVATGHVTIYHPLYRGSRILTPEDDPRIKRPVAAIVVVPCVCALGLFLRSRTGDPGPNAERTAWTLQDVLDGRLKGWVLRDPTDSQRPPTPPDPGGKKKTTAPTSTPAPQPKAVSGMRETNGKDTTDPRLTPDFGELSRAETVGAKKPLAVSDVNPPTASGWSSTKMSCASIVPPSQPSRKSVAQNTTATPGNDAKSNQPPEPKPVTPLRVYR